MSAGSPARSTGAIDVSVYGRDASDAQLLAKTARFLFYRDSGPTLALTRRQQVEHEAYLTLMADRAGVRVPAVLAAGPAGPARDALFVTRPPAGRRSRPSPPTSSARRRLPRTTTRAEDGDATDVDQPGTATPGRPMSRRSDAGRSTRQLATPTPTDEVRR